MSVSRSFQKKLLDWFEKNQRDLPWRKTRDPYAIWISEVMLQQTTSKAVTAYYERFLKKFPDVSSLSRARKRDLFPLWAGLGYYQRAENLILAAREISKKKSFPQTSKELLQLPGFGPYISRAVSSIAFEESVGVLDGNVIRFLSRFHAKSLPWWKTRGRYELQSLSDLWVKKQKASRMNQALMELGSLICKSQNPLCFLCPVRKGCQAFLKNLQNQLPLKRERTPVEYWFWEVEKIKKDGRWAFVKNQELPFLKGHFVFPGQSRRLKAKARKYDFVHSIMRYQIFITVQNKRSPAKPSFKWMTASEIKRVNPSSLIQKILNHS